MISMLFTSVEIEGLFSWNKFPPRRMKSTCKFNSASPTIISIIKQLGLFKLDFILVKRRRKSKERCKCRTQLLKRVACEVHGSMYG
ncbi:Os08g0177550 [Oryza sativa Japonica Group]|uniref:Os08g0177550 protein n=1 Tax=Oryza sativa subsp. japonica TaxID=39947 RepID=C7J5U4_ORYSJ|nr:Os08g0177550 [Oryza sativa Japonica Group]|eukprot:NP_001175411.1 Os08g0177550 [Oryza sativa Japonica Group]